MKKIIIIASLLFSMSVTAQDTTSYISRFAIKSTDYAQVSFSRNALDTFSVVMLVSDTSHQIGVWTLGVTASSNRDPHVYWIFGYAVQSKSALFTGSLILYLDERKRPINNHVVWMATPTRK